MDQTAKSFLSALRFGFSLVIPIWIVFLYFQWSGISKSPWGVFPREWDGAIGIVTSPLMHSGWEHLFSNSAPLLVTMTIIKFFYNRVALASTVAIYILTGFAVWLFGRSVYHIGASGVVYGLISFIFWSGIFRKNIKSIVLALVVTILYSGYLGGIVPFQEGISWESHLLGAIVGIIVAFVFRSIIEKDEEEYDPWAHEENQDTQYYFPRDIFEKTKHQRWLEIQEQKRQSDQQSNEEDIH